MTSDPGRPEPKRGRPYMPASYGVEPEATDAMLEWSAIVEQLTASRNYWIATTRADGRPHVSPVWGLWLDGAVLFAADSKSRKSLNLVRDPRVVVHLESGDDAVIVEGVAEVTRDAALLARFADAYDEKYAFRPEGMEGTGVFRVPPKVVLAWREQDFPNTATRFTFA